MAELDRPSAISASTSRSRGVNPSSGAPAAPGDELRDDVGVQDGTAAGHPAQRVEEVTDVGDPVLGQVPTPPRRSASRSSAYATSTYWDSTSTGELSDLRFCWWAMLGLNQ